MQKAVQQPEQRRINIRQAAALIPPKAEPAAQQRGRGRTGAEAAQAVHQANAGTGLNARIRKL